MIRTGDVFEFEVVVVVTEFDPSEIGLFTNFVHQIAFLLHLLQIVCPPVHGKNYILAAHDFVVIKELSPGSQASFHIFHATPSRYFAVASSSVAARW